MEWVPLPVVSTVGCLRHSRVHCGVCCCRLYEYKESYEDTYEAQAERRSHS